MRQTLAALQMLLSTTNGTGISRFGAQLEAKGHLSTFCLDPVCDLALGRCHIGSQQSHAWPAGGAVPASWNSLEEEQMSPP